MSALLALSLLNIQLQFVAHKRAIKYVKNAIIKKLFPLNTQHNLRSERTEKIDMAVC